MKRRFVMVAMPWSHERDAHAPLGHASLVAALKHESNLEIRQVIQSVSNDEFSITGLADHVMVEVEGLPHKEVDVGVGVYVWNDKHVKGLLHSLRDRGFEGRIVLGGPQISYAGPGLEQIYPEANAFIRGYAEAALCCLARSNERPKIRGVHYAGEIDRFEQAETSLRSLPSPWLDNTLSLGQNFAVRWETQRGCNFRCSFCQHRQPDARIPIAIVEASRLECEIDLFCKNKVRRISVLDPVFNRGPKHALDVLTQFSQRKYQGQIALQCRLEMVDEAFLYEVQKLDVTLEFGLQSIHKREYLAVGRPNNMAKVEQVLREVQRLKIKNEVSLIYGLPEQTLKTFQDSVNWCLGLNIPVIKAFPLLLLRGTELDREQEKWAFVVKEGDLPMVVSSSSFSSSDWAEMECIANALNRTECRHPDCLEALMKTTVSKVISQDASRLRAMGKGR
jgi:hypothetical protein